MNDKHKLMRRAGAAGINKREAKDGGLSLHV